jgi:hypothetical protein
LKQGLIKLGQSRQVVGTNVHVVKLEFHSAFFQLGCFFTCKKAHQRAVCLSVLGATTQLLIKDKLIHL